MQKHEATVDDRTYTFLAAVAKSAKVLGTEWMVTGAAGRIILLKGAYGLPTGRGTEDVDFGVMVKNWKQYQALVEQICRDPRFSSDPKQRQRIKFSEGGYIDLVPFGGIESSDHLIRWPPDNDIEMRVIGFQEACLDAVKVTVRDLAIPVISPAGMVLLKLIAWKERRYTRKDAADIAYVLRHYSTILSVKVLFNDYYESVEKANHDPDLAAAHVLGRKIAMMLAKDNRNYVHRLLENELEMGVDSPIVRDLEEYLAGQGQERAYQYMSHLKGGFVEIVPNEE